MSYGRSGRGYGGGYNNNNYRSSGFEKPVQTGKEYDVKITETGSRGDGIARIQGFVVFVKNGKVGQDTVKVKINSVGDRFATAEPVIVEAPATSSSTTEE
jgi:predicted RNA-binding protein with TRAM domain